MAEYAIFYTFIVGILKHQAYFFSSIRASLPFFSLKRVVSAYITDPELFIRMKKQLVKPECASKIKRHEKWDSAFNVFTRQTAWYKTWKNGKLIEKVGKGECVSNAIANIWKSLSQRSSFHGHLHRRASETFQNAIASAWNMEIYWKSVK